MFLLLFYYCCCIVVADAVGAVCVAVAVIVTISNNVGVVDFVVAHAADAA